MIPSALKPPFPLYILAGGQSRRFGFDKARASFHGQPLIRHVLDSFGDVVSPCVVVAARADEYQDLGMTTIADQDPGGGPLCGLQTALAHAAACHPGWIALAACDLTRGTPEALELLTEAAISETDRVAIFRSENGLEPFPGLYHTNLLADVTTQRNHGLASMRRFLMSAEAGVRLIDRIGLTKPYADADTPSELAQAQHSRSDIN